MRSQGFLRKSHLLLLGHSPAVHAFKPFPQPSSHALRRHHPCSIQNIITKRFLSTGPLPTESEERSTSAPTCETSALEDGKDISESPANVEEPDKLSPKPRRTRIASLASAKDTDFPEFPQELVDDILYFPTESFLASDPSGGLPPPEIFQEALDNLLITLHPQNQHRSLHATGGAKRPIEPTLGLYCPMEGGDYVVDLTIHELAYQTGSEVLMLDAVQLAAGEWGPFGKAAASLNLPNNPLHFVFPSLPPSQQGRSNPSSTDQDDHGSPFMFAAPTQMSISIPKVLSSIQGRTLITPTSRKTPAPSKLESFFETLVNMPFPKLADTSTTAMKNRPRLIYIRDFPTLAPSASVWYPALLAAVRQRRGMLGRSSNLTASPVTIIFGMTPPITPPISAGSSGSSNSLLSILMNRDSSPSSQVAIGGKPEYTNDWTESEVAEIAREKRLRSRLRKWERNATALHDDFPPLSTKQDNGDDTSPDIIVIGGAAPSSEMPSMLGLPPSLGVEFGRDRGSQFFRSSIIVPKSRSIPDERETRIARRREINELTMRMGVGTVGGLVEDAPAQSVFEAPENDTKASDSSLWQGWGNKIEAWSNVRKIADRAIGSVMSIQRSLSHQEKVALSPTVVPWSAVHAAWSSCHSVIDSRKHWLRDIIGHTALSDDLSEGADSLVGAGSGVDKEVESVKNDPDLDQHETRLLPCIVDSLSINTSFNQVHLPSHTIDAVRTIVSLPLLHPRAFQQGILKEHSMTGCLLFGPPGTGKTLVVRALAKEAGCRMLAISPSDVMDMYVGEGEKLVRAVFSLARRLSPCVVFLDEIDALFGARMSARESGSAHAHRGVITEFMQEMDGLKSSKEDNVIVIGATNRPFDLDDAVLRRLPRRLLVDLPGEKEREAILKILLRDETLDSDVNINSLAQKTEGFSGSDLKHLCVSAALDAVKEHMDVPWSSRHHVVSSLSSPTAELRDVVAKADGSTAPSDTPSQNESSESSDAKDVPEKARILCLHHFSQALKEITPSSSETLGSLADLRKWNEEFGEGRRDRKKRQVWGKDRFGFVNNSLDTIRDGRVANP
ncbi:hypothetical protein M413DRAFT_438366 [Hebeloma cylindrosporum]|uniref:AAA+ ATPase domain-containing protein n=1 Tax=Hebeloma cylindrosporum TaxID=76867 RepID=A0A0C3CZD9_HEBCY|nr:hypothetical protein M413DRAFT_438366 [Hebeloma cylindrosporum h7]